MLLFRLLFSQKCVQKKKISHLPHPPKNVGMKLFFILVNQVIGRSSSVLVNTSKFKWNFINSAKVYTM